MLARTAGSLLFRGHANDGQYSGTAYIFKPSLRTQSRSRLKDRETRPLRK